MTHDSWRTVSSATLATRGFWYHGVVRSFLLAIALLGACAPKQTDGDGCKSDDDCSTEYCTSYGVCSHSKCDCPDARCGGEMSADCRDGWTYGLGSWR